MDEQYAKYLNSPEWAEKRKQRLEMDGHRCVICHSEKDLEIHHVTYDRKYDEDVWHDLVTLCHNCHASVSGMLTFSEREETRLREIEQEKEMERERAWREEQEYYKRHPTLEDERLLIKLMANDKKYFDAVAPYLDAENFLEFREFADVIYAIYTKHIPSNMKEHPKRNLISMSRVEDAINHAETYDIVDLFQKETNIAIGCIPYEFQEMTTTRRSRTLTNVVQHIKSTYYEVMINSINDIDLTIKMLNEQRNTHNIVIEIPEEQSERTDT